MKLPLFKAAPPTKRMAFHFEGIDQFSKDGNFLHDAVNLTGHPSCQTRKARGVALLWKEIPDQIIPLEEGLFFRYQNELKQMQVDDTGALSESGYTISLTPLTPSPDRLLIPTKDGLCVFPDNLQIHEGENQWQAFAPSYPIKAKLPFISARTLFYVSGASGGTPCDESYLLRVGMKVKFSWIEGKEFSIIGADRAYSEIENGARVLEGFRITLDCAVTNWSNPPSDAKMFYCTPTIRPLLPSVSLGSHEEISYYLDTLELFPEDIDYSYSYAFLDLFHVGQEVVISNSGAAANNRTLQIRELGDNYIRFTEDLFPYTETEKHEITLTPVIPSLDYAVWTNDRLIGADNQNKTFWVSREGEPFVFHKMPTVAEDSWQCRLESTVTGLAPWKDSVLLFTEQGGYRLFGSGALHYGISKLPICGIPSRCQDTPAQIGDRLFYASSLGIMQYNGGSDHCISDPLPPELEVSCGAAHQNEYYALAGERLWVYHPATERWWSQDAEGIRFLFSAFGSLYLVSDQALYRADGANYPVPWSLTTAELPPQQEGSLSPSFCTVKLKAEESILLQVSYRARGGRWKRVFSHPVRGEDTLIISLPKASCEGFFLKLEGKGRIILSHLAIQYRRLSK